jgi:cytochrome b561
MPCKRFNVGIKFCIINYSQKKMEARIMAKTQKINTRAIVSMLMFFFIIILFLTAVGIQILDGIIDPEIVISQYLNPESQPQNILVELQHIITAIHVIVGFMFCGLSIIHIIKNWKALKTYFKGNIIKK